MAFLEVNPKKFAFLLTKGTHEGELRKFFSESKLQLLQRGAKAQNLPHAREERIRAITERLNKRTDDIVRSWFAKNISVAAPTALDEVLLYLEALFNEKEALPETDAQAICRSALSYLFDQSPDGRLLELLRMPYGSSRPQSTTASAVDVEPPLAIPVSSEPADSAPPGEHPSAPHSHEIAELIAAIISGDESGIDDSLAHFSENTRVLVEALLRLRGGDADAAREQLQLLPSSGPESELVQSALARASHQRTATLAPVGIRVVIPPPLGGIPSSDKYEVIGFYTNETSTGAIFVDPLFIVLDGQLRLLSKEHRVHLFPDSGSVMTSRSALRRIPKRGDLVHWSVSEREGVTGKTRFHMDSELNPLVRVLRVQVPSGDADEVRDRIKNFAKDGLIQVGQQTIFLLSDGVAVGSPKGADYSRDDAFEQPWQAWSSLDTWLIEGHQYCLDPSQSASSKLDLSPLDLAFRRLLKNLEAEQRLTSTKAQRREISDLIRSQSGGEIAQRAKRIAASIDQVSINEEELDIVLALLGSHDEVRRKVDELVTKELEARQAERAGLQADVTALKRRKAELEKEGRDIERQNRSLAESAASSVREAFSGAIKDGVTTLANAEIFHFLGGTSGSSARPHPAIEEPTRIDFVRSGSLSPLQVKARLSMLGINGRQSVVLSSLLALATQAGAALILKGSMARQCAQALIRQDRDLVGIVDVPMGATSGELLRGPLSKLAGVQGFALLNSDLSPFEIYAAELLDILMENAAAELLSPKPILVACLGGDFSLPLPAVLRRVSLVVDLDSSWDEGTLLLDEVNPDEIFLLPTLAKRVSDGISTLDESIRQHVERALVTAVRAC